jgi:uncharacterized glyoxalase superfamily protein PhnB
MTAGGSACHWNSLQRNFFVATDEFGGERMVYTTRRYSNVRQYSKIHALTLTAPPQRRSSFYESALGAKTGHVMRFGDTPVMNARAEQKDLILHAALKICDGTLMMTDAAPNQPVPTEGNINVALRRTRKGVPGALSAGGKVTSPLQ